MELSPYMLTLLLVYSFVFGIFCGAINDVLKITRALIFGDTNKKSVFSSVVIFFEDALFVVFIGCGIVVLNFYLNRGQLRAYSIAALLVGFVIYYFTVGKLVALISYPIVRTLKRAWRIVCSIVTYPIKAVLGCSKKIFITCVKKILFAIEKRRVIRYNKREVEKLVDMSFAGFVGDMINKEEKDEV